MSNTREVDSFGRFKSTINWNEIIPLMGKVFDSVLAKKFNLDRRTIALKRKRIGIKSVGTVWHKGMEFKHTEESKVLIGIGSKGNKYALGRKQPEEEKIRRGNSIRKFYEENPDKKEKMLDGIKKYRKENPEYELSDAVRLRSMGNICSWFETPVGKVQGTFELRYINDLIKRNMPLPTTPSKGIKTDFGYYFPDFEFPDRYIEIKSDYTFDVCIGKKAFWDGKISDNQMKKINYVRDFIKPVQIIIINKNGN